MSTRKCRKRLLAIKQASQGGFSSHVLPASIDLGVCSDEWLFGPWRTQLSKNNSWIAEGCTALCDPTAYPEIRGSELQMTAFPGTQFSTTSGPFTGAASIIQEAGDNTFLRFSAGPYLNIEAADSFTMEAYALPRDAVNPASPQAGFAYNFMSSPREENGLDAGELAIYQVPQGAQAGMEYFARVIFPTGLGGATIESPRTFAPAGQWTHLALCADATEFAFYVAGSRVWTAARGNWSWSVDNLIVALLLGLQGLPNTGIHGARITKQRLYTGASFTPGFYVGVDVPPES